MAALAVFIADQVSKSIARSVMWEGRSIPVVDNIFHLTLVYNTGAAFGLLKDHQYIFTWSAVIFSLAIIYIFLSGRFVSDRYEKTALSLILGGTLGNLTDRIGLGYVVDIFDLRIWPVFNVADSCITVGAAMLAFILITSSGRRKCTG
jgi:signal peptidase II